MSAIIIIIVIIIIINMLLLLLLFYITRSSGRDQGPWQNSGYQIFFLLSIQQDPVEELKNFSEAPGSDHCTLVIFIIYFYLFFRVDRFLSTKLFLIITCYNLSILNLLKAVSELFSQRRVFCGCAANLCGHMREEV